MSGLIRLWLRWGMTLALTLALVIAFIRLKPRDDAAIRAFFMPLEGCSAPCFLGIRPGVTTKEQALAILQAQPWVGTITVTPGVIQWAWNGRQPDFIGAGRVGQIWLLGGVVYQISLLTTTDWGDFVAIFGSPDQEYRMPRERSSGFRPYLFQSARYNARGFQVETTTACPLRSRADPWYSFVFVIWDYSDAQPPDPTSASQGC